MCSALHGVLVLTLTSLPVGAAPPAAIPGDEQDLVLLHRDRPYRLRLHLQAEGHSYRARWDQRARYLFDYLDVDHNGFLSKVELLPAPSAAQWEQLAQGSTSVEPDAAPDFAAVDVAPADGKISLAELRRYYQSVSAGPLCVRWTRRSGTDRRTRILFEHLDTNKDGKLSRAELEALPRTLNQLDLNGDEMIDAQELGPGFAAPMLNLSSASDPPPPLDELPFLVVPSEEPSRLLAERLLRFYDRDSDHKLSRAELHLDRAVFTRLDRNHDGALDAAELESWCKEAPDLELVVPLGERSSAVFPLRGADGKPKAATAPARAGLNGSFLLPLSGMQVEVRTAEGVRTVLGGPGRQQSPRDYFRSRFRALDANKDKYLDSKEIYRPPFSLVALLRLADRDNDNRISEAEMIAYLEMQDRLVGTQVHLTMVAQGRPFFELLDGDHDNRLSQRELRTAWKRLGPWAKQETLTLDTIPQQFELVLTRGPFGQPQQPFPGMGVQRPAPKRQGPRWFRKMDRNNDGDVSPAEFLGTVEQFRKLDRDGDGLLDAQEAEQADRALRKQRGR